MTHPPSEQLQRFYDGELPASERQAIETHLSDCAPCTSYLSQLGGIGQMLRGVDLPEFSDAARRRAISTMSKVRNDLALRHLSEWVIGVAALLIIGLMILPARKNTVARNDPSTQSVDVGYMDTVETAAVMPPTTHTGSNRQLVQFAQFMAGDVSASATR